MLSLMTEQELHAWLLYGVFALGLITFIATRFLVIAPYGRHVRAGWGPSVNPRLGWILMELPSALGFLIIFLYGDHRAQATPMIAAGLWCTHYWYRAFVYPFLIRSDAKKGMPLLVMLSGDFYNVINAYVNGRYLSQFGDYEQDVPWVRASFYVGLVLFAVGLAINIHSDQVLINLRKPGVTSGYVVPHAGLFAYVSAPNYFGEILEWCGWSIVAQSPAGWSFAVYTATNLVPRAISNHEWYHDKFKDSYPKQRKILVPGVW